MTQITRRPSRAGAAPGTIGDVVDDARVQFTERHVVTGRRTTALLDVALVLAIVPLIDLHLLDELQRRTIQLHDTAVDRRQPTKLM